MFTARRLARFNGDPCGEQNVMDVDLDGSLADWHPDLAGGVKDRPYKHGGGELGDLHLT